MTATTSDPRVIELACRLIEKLSAVHRETAQVDSNPGTLGSTAVILRIPSERQRRISSALFERRPSSS